MKIGLFIPCYIDMFYPNAGKATLQLLEKYGCKVEYPMEQTCCGQPMGNSGFDNKVKKTARHFVNTFSGYDYIVAPSGSCVHYVKHHYNLLDQTEDVVKVRDNIFELCDFLYNILNIKIIEARFPHQVGLHHSCHAHRGLRLGIASELNKEQFSYPEFYLRQVKDISIVQPERFDECCGFGGTFSVIEEAVSAKMGLDKVYSFSNAGAEVITALDMSCLMHLEGIIKRQKMKMKIMHLSEILISV